MEERKEQFDLLDQIPQPGLWVREGQILYVNPAAASLLIQPGDAFSGLLREMEEEYAVFQEGQLSLPLTVGSHRHTALITRMEEGDLVLLEEEAVWEEFRSMALVSMELRGPLMQAITAARQTSDPKLNRSLMQMLRMVSNMADISRYTASTRMELRDVDSFLLELFEKAAAMAAHDIRITFQGLEQPLFSCIDPEQLERAVWNILSNCMKFTPRGGRVVVSLLPDPIVLTVANTGAGIAAEDIPHVFKRFWRAEKSRSLPGNGLGLALVKAIASSYGGTASCLSESDGWTVFRITLTHAREGQVDSLIKRPRAVQHKRCGYMYEA
jgi:signal transduction histidine kinase